ncbi:hypothetical protein [Bacillus coahuilensis]|uniref:hypothetical protein n=1 Tax=Bacillus coahuilensis TaxID=408580 RepID=UPI0002E83D6C|nr:hypothetical protein [Bacillus coahuilensis]
MEIHQLHQQVKELESKKMGEYDSFSKQAEQTERKIALYEQEMSDLKIEVRNSEENLSKVQGKLNELLKEKEKWIAEMAEEKDKNDLLLDRVKHVQEKVEAEEKETIQLKEKLQEVEKRLKEAKLKEEKLLNVIDQITEEKLKIHLRSEEQAETFQTLLNQMNQMEEQYQRLQTQLDENNTLYQNVEKEKKEAFILYEESLQQNKFLTKEKELLEKEIEKTKVRCFKRVLKHTINYHKRNKKNTNVCIRLNLILKS